MDGFLLIIGGGCGSMTFVDLIIPICMCTYELPNGRTIRIDFRSKDGSDSCHYERESSSIKVDGRITATALRLHGKRWSDREELTPFWAC